MQWHTEPAKIRSLRRAVWRRVWAWIPRRVAPNHWIWWEHYEIRHVLRGNPASEDGMYWKRETRLPVKEQK